MKQLTQERLNAINANSERNDKMFIIEQIIFKETRHGLVREESDTVFGEYDTLEEAKAKLEDVVRYASMESEYYEVYIAQAFTWEDGTDTDVEYEQLEEYTVKTCEPEANKMEAYYI